MDTADGRAALRRARRGSALLSEIPAEAIVADASEHSRQLSRTASDSNLSAAIAALVAAPSPTGGSSGAGGTSCRSATPPTTHRRSGSGDDGGGGGGGIWHWLRSASEGWVAGRLVRTLASGAQEFEVASESGAVTASLVAAEDVGPRVHAVRSLAEDFDDMIKMSDVEEGNILHNLRRRFLGDVGGIFTSIGAILISLNPYVFFADLYAASVMTRYATLRAGAEAPPHIFSVAANAYRGLRDDRTAQAIIISGESGAGKTEATKKCLQYFSEVAGARVASMNERVLAANPILEAFGNARTVRNDNSSRFGKWLEVQFDAVHGAIIGCRVVNYLLEKSRVVAPAPTERSYHVFYQLVAAAPPSLRAALALPSTPDAFAYLASSGCTAIPGTDDAEEWADVERAFGQLAVEEADRVSAYTVAAAVLHLGNLAFADGPPPDAPPDAATSTSDGCCHVPRTDGSTARVALAAAASCLGVSAAALELELTSRVRVVAGATLRSPHGAAKAADLRNALAKALYARLFDWLVARVNRALAVDPAAARHGVGVIGVLDIFGFEIFAHNSFEQLCINYCNEKLQQHFNTHVFKAETATYLAEGIDFSEVRFEDNQDVLDTIEKRPLGLLPVLDDEVVLPGANDAKYIGRIAKIHAANPRFVYQPNPGTGGGGGGGGGGGRGAGAGAGAANAASRPSPAAGAGSATRLASVEGVDARSLFGVVHYAGVVTYDVTDFVEKNRDELFANLITLLASSSNAMVARGLFGGAAGGSGGGSGGSASGGGARRPTTQAGVFKGQLDDLMATLNATAPHYVRCIKPNNLKKPMCFEPLLVLQQLRYAGVFEAVRIRQQGFPFCGTYHTFYSRYHMVASRWAHGSTGGGGSGGAGGSTLSAAPPRPHTTAAKRIGGVAVVAPHDAKWYQTQCAAVVAGAVPTEPCLSGIKFGRTQLLYRAEQHRTLQRLRETAMMAAAPVLQRVYRGHAARVMAARLLALRARLRAAMAARALPELRDSVAAAEAAVAHGAFAIREVALATALRDRVAEEEAVTAALAAMNGVSPLEVADALADTLARAAALDLSNATVATARNRHAALARRTAALAALERGIRQYDRAAIADARTVAAEVADIFGGPIHDAAATAEADRVLAEIAAEEARLATLHTALAAGAPSKTALLAAASGALASRPPPTDTAAEDDAAGVPPSWAAGHAAALAAMADSTAFGGIDEPLSGLLAEAASRDSSGAAADGAPSLVLPPGVPPHVVAALRTLRTPDGRALVCLASLVRTIRASLAPGGGGEALEPHWDAVAAGLADIDALLPQLGGRLPSVLGGEVAAVRAALACRHLATELWAALAGGAAAASAAAATVAEVDEAYAGAGDVLMRLDGLAAAVAIAQPPLPAADSLVAMLAEVDTLGADSTTDEVAALARGARLVVELRATQGGGDSHEPVHAVLDRLCAGGGGDGTTLRRRLEAALSAAAVVPVARPEVLAAAASADRREGARLLLHALRDHGIAGTPGALDTTAVDVAGSEAALAYVAAAAEDAMAAGAAPPPPLAAAAAVLHDVMLPLRRAAAAGDDVDALRAAAAAAAAVQQRGGLPDALHAEAALVCAHTAEVDLIAACCDGVAAGGVHGNLEGIAVAGDGGGGPPSAAATAAATDPPASTGGALLAALVATLRVVRAEVAAGRVTAAAPPAEAALASTPPGAALLAAASLTPPGGGPQPPLARAAAGAVTAAMEECRLVAAYAAHERVLNSLRAVVPVAFGGVGGAVGAVDVAAVNTAILESALGMAAAGALALTLPAAATSGAAPTVPITPAVLLWLGTLRLLREVRRAAAADNWVAAERLLRGTLLWVPRGGSEHGEWLPLPSALPLLTAPGGSTAGGSASPASAPLSRMRTALRGAGGSSSGGSSGSSGGGGRGPAPPARADAVAVARQLVDCHTPIDGVLPVAVDAAAVEELALVMTHLEDAKLRRRLAGACAAGGASGAIGSLDTSAVTVAGLASAVADASAAPALSDATARVLAGARVLLAVRHAVVAGDWAAVPVEAGAVGALTAEGAACVAEEVARYVGEAHDRALTAAARRALAGGQPSGAVGHLHVAELDTRALADVGALADTVGIRTARASVLVATTRHVAAMRAAARDGDMDALRRALEAAAAAELAGEAEGELQVYCDETENRAMLTALTAALLRGAPTGAPGALELSSLHTTELADAVALAADLGAKSVEAVSLAAAGATILRLRTALAARDWAAAQAVVDGITDYEPWPPTPPAAAATPPPPGAISALCHHEVALARAELNERRVVAALTAALTRGAAEARAGHWDAPELAAGDLDAAVAAADTLGTLTRASVALRTAAAHMGVLRDAARRGDWGGVRAHLEAMAGGSGGGGGGEGGSMACVLDAGAPLLAARATLPPPATPEFDAYVNELLDRDMCTAIGAALWHAPGGLDAPLDAPAAVDFATLSADPLTAVLARAGAFEPPSPRAAFLLRVARLMADLRTAVAHRDADAAAATLSSVRDVGMLEPDAAGVLTAAAASSTGADSLESDDPVRRLHREVVVAGAWTASERITAACRAALPPAIAAWQAAIQTPASGGDGADVVAVVLPPLASCRAAVESEAAALAAVVGDGTGASPVADFHNIPVPLPADTRAWLASLTFLAGVAAAAASDSWSAVAAALAAPSRAALHPTVAPAVAALASRLYTRQVTATCIGALGGAATTGDASSGSASSSSSAIDQALALLDTLPTQTAADRHLHAVLQLVRRLRVAAANDDYRGVLALGERMAALPPPPDGLPSEPGAGSVLTAAARMEVDAAVADATRAAVDADLLAAVGGGAPAGAPGSLVYATLDVSGLTAAVASARTRLAHLPGAPPHATRSLLAAAEVLADVRACAVRGAWDDLAVRVDAALTAATTAVGVVEGAGDRPHAAILPELQAYADDVQARRATAALRRALATGGAAVDGDSGEVAVATISLADLDAAITLAAARPARSGEVRTLLASARLLAQVRTCALGEDWDGVLARVADAQVLGLLPGGGGGSGGGADGDALLSAAPAAAAVYADALAPECRAEVRLLATEAADRRVCRAVATALATGAATGPLLALDGRTVQTAALAASLSAAATCALARRRARRVVTSAALVLRARRAVLADRWDDVRALLAAEGSGLAAGGISPALPVGVADEARAELVRLGDEVRERDAVAALRAAAAAGLGGGDAASLLATTPADALAARSAEGASLVRLLRSMAAYAAARRRGDRGGVDTALGALVEAADGVASAASLVGDAATRFAVAARREHAAATVAASLVGALSAGGVVGTGAGGVACGPTSAAPLVAAIAAARAAEADPVTAAALAAAPEVRALLDLAAALVQLRQAVATDDWPAVASAADAVEAAAGASGGGQGSGPLAAAGRAVAEEVAIVRAALRNGDALAGVAAALRVGGATGDGDDWTPAGVDVAHLAAALAVAAGVPPSERSDALAAALAAGSALVDVRRAVAIGDWVAVGTLLGVPDAGAVLAASATDAPMPRRGTHHRPTPAAAAAALDVRNPAVLTVPAVGDAVREADAVRRAVVAGAAAAALWSACARGRISGGVGGLDATAVDLPAMDAALAGATPMLTATSARLRALAGGARALRALRAAVAAGDGDSARRAAADIQRAPRGYGGAGIELPATADVEAALVAASAAHGEAGSMVVAALVAGGPAGVPGELVPAAVAYAPLEDAAAGAVALLAAADATLRATVAAAAATVAAAATTPRALGGVGALPSDATADYDALLGSLESGAAPAAVATALVVARLRRALVADDWTAVRALVHEAAALPAGVVDAAVPELELVIGELHHRAVMAGPLATALAAGGPIGAAGALDLRGLAVAGLDAALEHAAAVGVTTPAASRLVESAGVVRAVRAALAAGDEEALTAALTAGSECDLVPAAAAELALVADDAAQRDAVAALRDALTHGSGVTPGGGLDVAGVSCAALDAAIARAEGVGGLTTPDGRLLLHTARTMRALRACLLADDLGGIVSVLEGARAGALADLVADELAAVLAEFDERAVCSELVAALRTGGVAGGAGALDVTGVDVRPLDAALTYAASLGCRTPRARALMASAQGVRRLRTAVAAARRGGGAAATEVDAALRALMAPGTGGGGVAALAVVPEAAEEVALVRDDRELGGVARLLEDAIATGSVAVGVDGTLDLAAVAVAPLDAVLPRALQFVAPPTAFIALRNTAVGLRALRAALAAGDLEGGGRVADTLAAAYGGPEASSLVAAGAVEVAAAQHGVARQRAQTAAWQALQEAVAGADVGAIEASLAAGEAAGLSTAAASNATLAAGLDAARRTAAGLRAAAAGVARGLQSKHLPDLEAGVAAAEDVGLRTPAVAAAVQLRDALRSLYRGATEAIERLDAGGMADALARAAALGVVLPSDGYMQRLLALPVKARLQLALRAALERRDVDGVAAATMDLKALFFADAPGAYALPDCAALRPPTEFAALAPGAPFLTYSPAPLPRGASLTRLPPDLVPAASAVSATILAYTGELAYADRDALAAQLVAVALMQRPMADEVLLQLLRHLSGGACPALSYARGRALLAICLRAFPPSEAVENTVEAWLRRAGESAAPLLLSLHRTAHVGALTVPPSVVEVARWAADVDA